MQRSRPPPPRSRSRHGPWPALARRVLTLQPLTAPAQTAPGASATVQVAPQPVLPKPQLLALLLVNLARYAERADGVDRRPEVLVCTVGVGVGGLAIDMLTSRQARGRPIRHLALSDLSGSGDCELVFIADSEGPRLPLLLQKGPGHGVLTVSTAAGFLDAGGMVQLEAMGERFVFDINLAALRAARLRLPPGVLSLARRVVGTD